MVLAPNHSRPARVEWHSEGPHGSTRAPVGMRPTFITLTAVLTLLATGCGGSSTHQPPTATGSDTTAGGSYETGASIGRVAGTLSLVGRQGRAIHTRTVFRVLFRGRVVRRVRTDKAGQFRFAAPAGTYTLAMVPYRRIVPRTFRVSSGATTHLRLIARP